MRIVLILAVVTLVAAVSLLVGFRYGLLISVGVGFGLVLEGLRFGFAGPWRSMIVNRDPSGVLGHLLAIAIAAIIAIPLLEWRQGELTGAEAPIGFAMVAGAFCFGIAMQVVLACGSGTLVNAGSGNLVSLIALPFFAVGSFVGSYHLFWWTELGFLPAYKFSGFSGLLITLVGLVIIAILFLWMSPQKYRKIPRRYIVAALLLALLASLNLVLAGQPWGVVYGLGLWVAKGVSATGFDLSSSIYWSASSSVERLQQGILTDYTSLTNIGIVLGAFFVSCWRRDGLSQKLPILPIKGWLSAIISGFILGYTARLAFGCNVGAFFSGISTGSLHGWIWFGAAFLGSIIGVKIRPYLGLVPKS